MVENDDLKIKQVLVWRHDLKVRRGKQLAQISHASMKFIVDRMQDNVLLPEGWYSALDRTAFSEAELSWMQGLFTKICVRVNSEEELYEIHHSALEAGLVSSLIIDSGATEFNGVPTPTCIAIGPTYSSLIDPITSNLELL